MVSHKHGLSVSIKGGLRFTKRPSAHNICIGNMLAGQMTGPGSRPGGRYNEQAHQLFRSAVASCPGRGAIARPLFPGAMFRARAGLREPGPEF